MIEHNRMFFNSRAEIWDDITNHNPKKIRFLLNKLALNPNSSILDVGTGTGILIPFLLETTNNTGYITAIDLSEKMIDKAKEKFANLPINFIVGDATQYNFLQNSFDAIICYSVFPHFIDPLQTIKKLATLLKENGQLIVCHSECKEKIDSRHREIKNKLISHGLPAVDETALLFKKAGLLVIDQEDNDEL
jgi:demethylmenaquinone methyltransferase/2-methoxy-6-polyprenyl-1,4-benzoquinol methylase